MGALPRYVPRDGNVIEVGSRTMQGRFLLRPSPETNAIILGVLGRAQRIYKMTIHAFQFLSDHYHMLLSPNDAKHLAEFMDYVNGNIARKIGKRVGWRGHFWQKPYFTSVIQNDEVSQLKRLKYLLANGCKEGLVSAPQDWPGASSTMALLNGTMSLTGKWINETKAYRSRLRGRTEIFEENETVHLTLLPCLAGLKIEEFRRHMMSIAAAIEEETASMHRQNGTRPKGAAWVRRQHPLRIPKEIKHSPAQPFYAATLQGLRELKAQFQYFISSYRDAAARQRAGDLDVNFPPGCFPPASPFISFAPG